MDLTPNIKQFYKKLTKCDIFQIFDHINLTETGIIIEFADMAVCITNSPDAHNQFMAIIAESPHPDAPTVIYARNEAKMYTWLQMVAASLVSNRIKQLAKTTKAS